MIDDWVITPGEGVGPIRFDMAPGEVAKALGAAPRTVDVYDEDLQHAFANGVRVYWRDGRMMYVELLLADADVRWTLQDVVLVADAHEQGTRLAAVGRRLVDESGSGGFYARIEGTPVLFWMDDDRSGVLDTAIVESSAAS